MVGQITEYGVRIIEGTGGLEYGVWGAEECKGANQPTACGKVEK